jgi:NAD(P)-dependent dehydrogenase (short-subunit alcohol dehydrogenase family)
VITLLASARASYVAGTMIPVDGGLLRLDPK